MDYTNDCILAKDRAMAAAQEELRLFCKICGMPVGERNYLIGGNPHGVAEINDTYWLNMSDVHVVVSEYERWLKLYGDNAGIAKAVREWYYWSKDWHEKHPIIEWQRISKEKEEVPDENTLILPDLNMDSKMKHKRYSKPVLIVDEMDLNKPIHCDQMPASVAMYDYDAKDWWLCELGVYYNDTFNVEITHWKYIDWPDDTYCPNLRSWLAGCPVPGLREATEEYKRRTEKELTAAHLRVESAQEELRKAIAAEKECY
jgi:hypothetical protein